MPPLKLFWARGTGGDEGLRNAGDWYSPLLCERLSGRRVVYAPPDRCDLVAVGSLLHRLNRSHRLHRLGLRRRLHIWGTGSLRAGDRLHGRHHVHAVRGTLTRARVEGAAAAVPLGDPGLLADQLLSGAPRRRFRLGVVPHLVDREDAQVRALVDKQPHGVLVDLRAPVEQVLETIAGCEVVVSSSLHGLVFADALGVPNRWLTVGDRLLGGRHKFDDYYSAFGLTQAPAVPDEVDATCLDGILADYRRPGLDTIKDGLLGSFPCRR